MDIVSLFSNGPLLLNHLIYADDLVILSPYSCGLQMLLNIYTEYGIEADKKIQCIRSKYDRDTVFPDFVLTGALVSISSEVKYLGHFMSDD